MNYIGRFAPSPSGPLHAGSIVAALASWLDARAHGGQWLVRIEDVDGPRTAPGAAQALLRQLAALGLVPDEAPVWQSQRGALYQDALDRLARQGQAYRCGCTRRDIDAELAALGAPSAPGQERRYPGTCREGLHGKPARAWRLRVPEGWVHWQDRRLGAQSQDVARTVGDFVLQRADGPWAYQLAVVVDDAAQGVTHVVRGEDLADNTARQILLQDLLGLPTPLYLHTPLVRDAQGRKLSKSNGAAAIDPRDAVAVLHEAVQHLGLAAHGTTVTDLLNEAVRSWRDRHPLRLP
jgi:glutamyl-Q tRNA(Asp) synthetase